MSAKKKRKTAMPSTVNIVELSTVANIMTLSRSEIQGKLSSIESTYNSESANKDKLSEALAAKNRQLTTLCKVRTDYDHALVLTDMIKRKITKDAKYSANTAKDIAIKDTVKDVTTPTSVVATTTSISTTTALPIVIDPFVWFGDAFPDSSKDQKEHLDSFWMSLSPLKKSLYETIKKHFTIRIIYKIIQVQSQSPIREDEVENSVYVAKINTGDHSLYSIDGAFLDTHRLNARMYDWSHFKLGLQEADEVEIGVYHKGDREYSDESYEFEEGYICYPLLALS